MENRQAHAVSKTEAQNAASVMQAHLNGNGAKDHLEVLNIYGVNNRLVHCCLQTTLQIVARRTPQPS